MAARRYRVYYLEPKGGSEIIEADLCSFEALDWVIFESFKPSPDNRTILVAAFRTSGIVRVEQILE